jgi:streptomycin 6-kinase
VAVDPAVLAALAEEWDLKVGEPYPGGAAGWAAPVTTADGAEAVLKLSLPHREAQGEAAALRLWDGRGAIRLLRHDPHRWALLLERCRPGTKLGDAGLAPEEALAIAASSLTRLWSIDPGPAEAFERVADVCADWAELVRRRMDELRPPFDPGLVTLGASLLEELPRSGARSVVVHGDFNPGNVLAAQREPWLAIDPKPMVGDPAYDPWPMLMQLDPAPATVGALRERAGRFGDLVGEPARRLLAWGLARTVEDALWHVSRHELADGHRQMAVARLVADALSAT